MKVRDLFPGRYLKADDLGIKEVELEISAVKLEDVNGDDKAVLYFKSLKKGLVLNKTNAEAIVQAYGEDTDGWIGKTIVVFPTRTQFQGKVVPCLRVRVPAAVADDEEIAF